MPNWCENTIIVRGSKEQLDMFEERATHSSSESDIAITNFFPPPPDVLQEEGPKLYHWCISNWGIKWGLISSKLEQRTQDLELIYTADTAWGPPIEAFIEISKLFPTLTFRLKYFEPGNGLNGYTDIVGGGITFEEQFDIEDGDDGDEHEDMDEPEPERDEVYGNNEHHLNMSPRGHIAPSSYLNSISCWTTS